MQGSFLKEGVVIRKKIYYEAGEGKGKAVLVMDRGREGSVLERGRR